VNRNCTKYDIKAFVKQMNIEGLENVELYIDNKQKKEILAFLSDKKNKSKFRRILYEIGQNRYPSHLYRKEPYDLVAMKFAGGLNPRIYCKELFTEKRKIVMIHLLAHKTQKKAQEKSLGPKLKSISKFEYNL